MGWGGVGWGGVGWGGVGWGGVGWGGVGWGGVGWGGVGWGGVGWGGVGWGGVGWGGVGWGGVGWGGVGWGEVEWSGVEWSGVEWSGVGGWFGLAALSNKTLVITKTCIRNSATVLSGLFFSEGLISYNMKLAKTRRWRMRFEENTSRLYPLVTTDLLLRPINHKEVKQQAWSPCKSATGC